MMGYGPEWGMMGGWGFGHGVFGLIIWLVILVAIVAAIVWLIRAVAPAGIQHSSSEHSSARRSSGLDVLEERYARGEINQEEFLQKKRDIAG
jgi:putative membrane protein